MIPTNQSTVTGLDQREVSTLPAGPIFKICIPGETDRVFINQPELLRTLMSKEGKMPVEPGFDPLVYYRNVIR